MSTNDTTTMQAFWGELDICVTLNEKFSDDFLVDDGLLDDDIHPEPYEFDASTVFDESNHESSSTRFNENRTTEPSTRVVHTDHDSIKKVRYDHSRSPSPKRRKSSTPMVVSPSPSKSCASMGMSPSSTKACASPPMPSLCEDHEIQYKLAIKQLTSSMIRSEMTRSEIVSYRRAEVEADRERRQKQEGMMYAGPSSADHFSILQPTITVGLAQSRQMLKEYMNMTLQR